jgi:transposase
VLPAIFTSVFATAVSWLALPDAPTYIIPAYSSSASSLVAFLGQMVALESKGREIHIIADNLSAHKTKRVAQFLADHPKLHLHFTPTYSSWLNQVELWFARIEREVVARGVFTSVNDLARKLMRYIRHHHQHAAPIKWAYRDFAHRIIATFDPAVTGH